MLYHGYDNVVNQHKFGDNDCIPHVIEICDLTGKKKLGPVDSESC